MSTRENVKLNGKLALLKGGDSSERDVSLISGKAVGSALERLGYEHVLIDCSFKKLQDELMKNDIKHAFIMLHGGAGENGQVQALLEGMDITYTGSGVMGCAIAMDKRRTKLLWKGAEIPTAKFMMVNNKTSWSQVESQLGSKVIIKPANEGSSIGMSIADSKATFDSAISLARQYDQDIMAEKWISGEEYTVAILDGKAMPMIRLKTDNHFYDYEAKYQSSETQYICPCGLSVDREKEIQNVALKAFEVLGCKGWGRIDVMTDNEDEFYLLEANTVPGMTDHSLVPMAAMAAGIEFDQLINRILALSL